MRDFFDDVDCEESSDSSDSSGDEGADEGLSSCEEALGMRNGCGCSGANHFLGLSVDDVCSHHLSCMELERGELDSVILGRLSAGVVITGQITASGKERHHYRYKYTFSGKKCAFLFSVLFMLLAKSA